MVAPRRRYMRMLTGCTSLLRMGVHHAIKGIPPDSAQVPGGIQARVGSAEGQGVRMARVGEEVPGRQGLHDLAQIKDQEIVGQAPGQVQVMGDEQDRLAFRP